MLKRARSIHASAVGFLEPAKRFKVTQAQRRRGKVACGAATELLRKRSTKARLASARFAPPALRAVPTMESASLAFYVGLHTAADEFSLDGVSQQFLKRYGAAE
jgi:hypothetical protein